MKVYYPGPGQKTYHPELGKLVTGEPFELDDELAKKYVRSGLLRPVKEKEKKDGNPTDR